MVEKEEISTSIQDLLEVGILVPTNYLYNSPVWSVKKSQGLWRLTLNYEGLNKVVPPIASEVPDLFLSVEIKKQKNYNALKETDNYDLSYKCFFLDLDIRKKPNVVCLHVGRSQFPFASLPGLFEFISLLS